MYCGSGAAGSRGRGGIVVVLSVEVEHPESGEGSGDGGDGEVDAVMSVVSYRRWNTSPSVLRNHPPNKVHQFQSDSSHFLANRKATCLQIYRARVIHQYFLNRIFPFQYFYSQKENKTSPISSLTFGLHVHQCGKRSGHRLNLDTA